MTDSIDPTRYSWIKQQQHLIPISLFPLFPPLPALGELPLWMAAAEWMGLRWIEGSRRRTGSFGAGEAHAGSSGGGGGGGG